MKKLLSILNSVSETIKESILLMITCCCAVALICMVIIAETEGAIFDYVYLMGIGAMTIFVLDLYITEIRPKKNEFIEKQNRKKNFDTMAVFHEVNFNEESKPSNVIKLKRK